MEDFIRSVKRFLGKVNGKTRYVFFFAILLICIISLCLGIYIEFYTTHNSSHTIEKIATIGKGKTADEYATLKSNFNNLFTNELKVDKTVSVKKASSNKDIVYTGYDIQNEDESFYYVNAKIPTINIDNTKITEINQKIRADFYDKANSIMRQSNEYIVYNVSYVSYINNNVLSVAVKASLKEGDSIERIILKTYCFDIESNETISFENLLGRKSISKSDAQKEIKQSIKSAYNNAKALSDQFEGIYQRDLKSEIYNIENAENYFITNDGDIYLVYSYGNTEETNEMDIIIF